MMVSGAPKLFHEGRLEDQETRERLRTFLERYREFLASRSTGGR
jgi:hypothetical protein